ncbi:DUF4238 domain-containing protein [Dechloromonas sp. ZS-1]|uniref:DUF4238 domain-containing protein n=1 Tax=Dechloromonas sp. ZS-1 TaxID=3138067 RepID=UPI0031FDB9DD
MSQEAFRRNNHFVPRMHLARWATDGKRVWAYQLLVSHDNVPLWDHKSISSTASVDYLYAQTMLGVPDDEMEKWLCDEFETPAKDAIDKAINRQPLTPSDWERLAYFLAAQDVRTPARLQEALTRHEEQLPEIIDSTLERLVLHLQNKTLPKEPKNNPSGRREIPFPMRIIKEVDGGADMARIGVEVVSGRALWLFSIRHLLNSAAKALLKTRWTILRPPQGLHWLTSDSPVIKLNYYGPNYDFKGGWGNPGTEILFPLSPSCLMYTKVGDPRPPPKYTVVSPHLAAMFQRFITEHAHRNIYSMSPDPSVPNQRPRIVDAQRFQDEKKQLEEWHEKNIRAERDLFMKSISQS